MLEQLEIYINAQKTIANNMLAMGLLMVLGTILIHFAASNPLLNGFKIGLLLLGVFSYYEHLSTIE